MVMVMVVVRGQAKKRVVCDGGRVSSIKNGDA